MKYACTRRKCPLLTDDLEREPVKRCSAKDCPYRTQTNADRIRAMTDEELAEWITELTDCTVYPHTRKDAPCVSIGQTCAASWLEWLKQEANDAT